MGPGAFVLAWLSVSLVVAIVVVTRRAARAGDPWAGWKELAADRGLEVVEGDPLGVGPALSVAGTNRVVQRTLSGTIDGTPVAVVVTTHVAGDIRQLQARSDLFGLASVGAPVPIERIRAALGEGTAVRVGAVGGLAVLEPVDGVRMAADQPPPEAAARLLELAVRAGWAARS